MLGPFGLGLSLNNFPDPLQGLHNSFPVPWQSSHSTATFPIITKFVPEGVGGASFFIFPLPIADRTFDVSIPAAYTANYHLCHDRTLHLFLNEALV